MATPRSSATPEEARLICVINRLCAEKIEQQQTIDALREMLSASYKREGRRTSAGMVIESALRDLLACE